MIRSHLPTPDEIEAQRCELLPDLREFEATCRAATPLPAPDEFSRVDRCRYHGYLQKLAVFKPHSPLRETFPGILHSDAVGLVAAEYAFRSVRSCLVMLTPTERKQWFDNHPELDHIGGWYWFLFWKIHTVVPDRLRRAVVKAELKADCVPWILTHGLGSSAWHELWSYRAGKATLIDGAFGAIVAEHGPIDEWYE